MFSESQENEIRKIAKEQFHEELTDIEDSNIEFSDQIPDLPPDSAFWKCIGKVKNCFVWLAVSPAGKIVHVGIFLVGLYDLAQIGTEIVVPGTLPDAKVVAQNLNLKLFEGQVSPPIQIRPFKQSKRYLAFTDEMPSLTSTDAEFGKAIVAFDLGSHMDQVAIIPEASGIIGQDIYDRGRTISRSLEDKLDFSQDVDVEKA